MKEPLREIVSFFVLHNNLQYINVSQTNAEWRNPRGGFYLQFLPCSEYFFQKPLENFEISSLVTKPFYNSLPV